MGISKLKITLLSVMAVIGASLFAAPAKADAQFCNNSSVDLIVALRDVIGTPGNYVPETFGWMSVPAGTCFKFYTGDASKFYFYVAGVYRKSTGDLDFMGVAGESPFYFCAAPFDFKYQGTYETCPTDYYPIPFYRYSSAHYDATFSVN